MNRVCKRFWFVCWVEIRCINQVLRVSGFVCGVEILCINGVSSGVICGVDGLGLMGYSCYSCNCAGHRRADCCFENGRYRFLILGPENDS